MTAPLSQDLRKRLVAAVAEGSSARAAAGEPGSGGEHRAPSTGDR